jgi:hypothetical protein
MIKLFLGWPETSYWCPVDFYVFSEEFYHLSSHM